MKDKKKFFKCMAGGIMAACTLALYLQKKQESFLRERVEKNCRQLSDTNIKLENLLCASAKIGEGYVLPIDSETVKRFRNKVEALEAEKELFLVLIRYAVRLDDEENALGGINDMLMGEYSIGKNVKISQQIANAKINVDFIRTLSRSRKFKFDVLEGYSTEDLCRGAVLLENDIYWMTCRRRDV